MANQAEKKVIAKLQIRYVNELAAKLAEELQIKNKYAIPNLEKIVLNIGAGKSKDDKTLLEELEGNLAVITGQKPIITKAKAAISNFKIREEMPIGLKVTLRGERMWYFLDKFINIALPRTKDFRGVNKDGFDRRGNYSIGIPDYTIFPEIDTTKSIRLHGLQISIITTTNDDKEAFALLKILGMPFKK